MATFTAETYQFDPISNQTKRYALTYPNTPFINQFKGRYADSVSFFPDPIVNILNRVANPPVRATWIAKVFAEEGGGGVSSEEFPTVYGYQ